MEPEILLDGEHDIDRTLEVAEATWAETFKYLADNNVLFEGILLKPSMVTPGAEHAKKATPEEVRARGGGTQEGGARALPRSPDVLLLPHSGPSLGPAAGCVLHPEDAAAPRAPGRAWHHVPVWRPERAGVHTQPERHEPEPQPVARVLLLRSRAAGEGTGAMGGPHPPGSASARCACSAGPSQHRTGHATPLVSAVAQNTVLKTWKGEEGNVETAQAALLKRAKANSDAQLGKYDPAGESSDAAQGMFEKGYSY